MSIRAAILGAVVVVGIASAATAGPCKDYTGTFTAIAPADCFSPVGICTHGTLVGDFPSTYDFVADTLTPTENPVEFTYTGHSVITSHTGATLLGSDSGRLTIRPDGTAAFVTTVELVGGTRQYAGVTGQFVAPGVLNLGTGATVGSYTATICKDEDAQ